ncbi:hypothetical protein [Streptomyces sp. NPDC101237]|uniref:hypothetical protein n=1 Tax=Streptomyces sp. NPDC101237 TaxID=3366139 RepID=UPI0038241457
MSENRATRVLEDGQKPHQLRASELRPPLAATTAARDGDFPKAPESGEGIVGELAAVFHQIMDRSVHFTTEVQRVKRELVRHGRLDERVSAGREYGGTGLGLSVSREIAGLPGGRVVAAGEQGRGSTSTLARLDPDGAQDDAAATRERTGR